MFEFSFVNDLLLAIHRATGIELVPLRNTLRILTIALIMPLFVYVLLNSFKFVQTLISRIISKHSRGKD
jgi:hypothetical protein